MKIKRILSLALVLILALGLLAGCGQSLGVIGGPDGPTETIGGAGPVEYLSDEDGPPIGLSLPEYGEYYYDLENVVLYLYLYDELPDNYITKSQARDLGWSGGSVEDYQYGAAIGGDRFGNREGLLPEASGRSYTECDLNTLGLGSRGAERLVFSSDGLFFYTDDHYESFSEVTVTEDLEVIW